MCQNFVFFIEGVWEVVVVYGVLILIPFFFKIKPQKTRHGGERGVTKD